MTLPLTHLAHPHRRLQTRNNQLEDANVTRHYPTRGLTIRLAHGPAGNRTPSLIPLPPQATSTPTTQPPLKHHRALCHSHVHSDDANALKRPSQRSMRPHLTSVPPGKCKFPYKISSYCKRSPLHRFPYHPLLHLQLHPLRLVPLEERYYLPQTSPECCAFQIWRECCRHLTLVLPLPRLLLISLLMTCLYL